MVKNKRRWKNLELLIAAFGYVAKEVRKLTQGVAKVFAKMGIDVRPDFAIGRRFSSAGEFADAFEPCIAHLEPFGPRMLVYIGAVLGCLPTA